MASPTKLDFNKGIPRTMHIDLNSCFASVEQQANPLLRGVPIAVAAYAKPYGCILAPSIEAKTYGIKTGMTVAEGLKRCPFLVVREPDPDKYRVVHGRFTELLKDYSEHIVSKSIDEFALTIPKEYDTGAVGKEIKSRIKSEIGDWLRVSIGVSTNQSLAKLASGLHKPDGFDVIDHTNYWDVYEGVELQDFCGINRRNEARLHRVGIFTARQFAAGSIQTLKQAFQSTLGRYWYLRLRGYEIDDVEFRRRSFGQSYVLPRPMGEAEWRPILVKLAGKAARRMRASGYGSGGIHLAFNFGDHTSWHTGHAAGFTMVDDKDIVASLLALYRDAPKKPVKKIAVSCFGLVEESGQLSLLEDTKKRRLLVSCLDKLNDKWGEYSVTYASFLGSQGHVRDAIAFGRG